MAFFLAKVLGSSFQQPRQLLRGRGQQIRRRDAHDGPVALGEAGALERDLELRPIMVPARADGDAGLTIHGASLRK